jgi:ketosteroid isomerase-like protein
VVAARPRDHDKSSKGNAFAARYTDDAVKVTVHGTFHGREAIAKDFAEHDFQRYQANNDVHKGDRIVAAGNDVRVTGKWSCAFHDTDGKYKHIDGHYSWILVREGDSWKIRKDTTDEGTGY